MALLTAMLRDGPRPAREIQKVAQELRISASTLHRARIALGVQIVQGHRNGHFDGSVWELETGKPGLGPET